MLYRELIAQSGSRWSFEEPEGDEELTMTINIGEGEDNSLVLRVVNSEQGPTIWLHGALQSPGPDGEAVLIPLHLLNELTLRLSQAAGYAIAFAMEEDSNG